MKCECNVFELVRCPGCGVYYYSASTGLCYECKDGDNDAR